MTRTLDGITLKYGAHTSPRDGMCAMEAAAYIAGEPHTDYPECVSRAVAAFMRVWNDVLPDDETRTRLLAPLVPLTVGTRTTTEDDETRAWMATDWLVRVCDPAWLRTADLHDHADRLASLAPIACAADALAAQPSIDAAGDAAWADAGDAAWAATGEAAWAAAVAAARAAAGEAAWDATRAAAWAAAREAARAAADEAARAAADEALAPTVTALQASAQDLVRRMCAVGTQGAE